MADLSVNICGVDFKNPIIPASGVFGYGREYEEFYPLSALGGIATKGTTGSLRPGNPAPRIAETPGGMLNSVGLQNPGIDTFIEKELPNLLEKDTVILANIAGATAEECAEVAARLDSTDVHMIELNISCPNVRQGGAAFGTSCDAAAQVTAAVRRATKKPLVVKLSPNVMSITEIALYFQSHFGIPMSVEEMKQCWIDMSVKKYAEEIGLKPHAGELLRALKDLGIPMSICSSSHIDMISACMDHNRIRPYFDFVTTACEVERGKPSPDIYLLAAERHHVDPSRCVAFEDVTQGILSAKAAGMTAVCVYDPFSDMHMQRNRAAADFFIRDYSEVLSGL